MTDPIEIPMPTVRKPAEWTLEKAVRNVGLIALGAFLGLMANRGRPFDEWFYALVFVVAFATCLAIVSSPIASYAPSEPPLSRAKAFAGSALAFVGTGGWFFLFMFLMTAEKMQWIVAIPLSLASAVTTYRARRGRPYSRWPMVIIVGGLIAVLVILLVLKHNHVGPYHR